MNWYLGALKKYAVFEGRARRREYWFFVLFNILVTIALVFVDAFMATMNPQTGIGVLTGLYTLAVFIPSISVLVRRLHDTNRSGWWFWISLVPLIGGIVLLVFMLLDGTAGDNDYGPDQKGSQY